MSFKLKRRWQQISQILNRNFILVNEDNMQIIMLSFWKLVRPEFLTIWILGCKIGENNCGWKRNLLEGYWRVHSNSESLERPEKVMGRNKGQPGKPRARSSRCLLSAFVWPRWQRFLPLAGWHRHWALLPPRLSLAAL